MSDKLYIVKTFNDKIIENNAYFKTFGEAENFIIFNTNDINDGGVFDYAMIHIVHYNESYTEHISDIYSFFKYNKNSNSYYAISKVEGLKALNTMYENKFKKKGM